LTDGEGEQIGQALVAAGLGLSTAARAMIQEASAKWPGLKEYLNATGLGSDPKLIQ